MFLFLSPLRSPFIGKAFHQFDSDQEGVSADQLEPDEWMVGLMNYCTLTPEALARFAFEMYDDDGSEFISYDELGIMVDDVFGDDFDKEGHIQMLIKVLDSDEDGVIEYSEWRKTAHQASMILKPAIVLQSHLQQRCFGHRWWDNQKARIVPIVVRAGYPNVLQVRDRKKDRKKEILFRAPHLVANLAGRGP